MFTKNKKFLIFLPLICLGFLLVLCSCNNSDAPLEISVVENSFKTQYFVGESVDLTGAKFVVTYQSGNKEEFGVDSEFIDVNTNFIENSTAGKKNLTIIFNKVAEKQIFVNVEIEFLSIDLVKIELNKETLPTMVKQNAEIDFSLVQGIATYSNNSTENISAEQIEFSKVDTSICGEQIVTATFGGKSAIFTINVERLVIEQITFSGGVFSEYYQGEEISLAGIIIQIKLDDGSTLDFRATSPSIEISGLSTSEKGNFEVVARYVGEEYKLIEPNIRVVHAYTVI